MEIQSQKKLIFKNNLYKIAILTFVTTVFWIGLEIYRSYNKPETTERVKTQIVPLNPNIDVELIDKLESRTSLTAADFSRLQEVLPEHLKRLQENSDDPTSRPPVPTPSPQSTTSATPTQSPESSPSSQPQL